MSRNQTKDKDIRDLRERMEALSSLFTERMTNMEEKCQPRTSFGVTSKVQDVSEELAVFKIQVLEELNSIKVDLKSLEKRIQENNEIAQAQAKVNSIIIYGLKEDETNIYTKIIDMASQKLNINIKKCDLNYCYRLGSNMNKTKNQRKPRPVVVEFSHRWVRDEIFFAKKKLKGTSLMITEFLTKETRAMFKVVRASAGKNSWTVSGQIYVMYKNKKVVITSEEQWLNLNYENVSENSV